MRRRDPKKHRERVLRSGFGVVLIAAGIWVFLRNPEHATPIALLLVGIGGGIIDPSLVGSVVRSRAAPRGYDGPPDDDVPEAS